VTVVHARRLGPGGKPLPCRPYGYDTVRCFCTHAEGDPAIGARSSRSSSASARPKMPPRRPSGSCLLAWDPKTVVNTHRMLHRAWEDFTTWGWAKRNVVSDAHPNPLANLMQKALSVFEEGLWPW
jgi:hypothetical protein